LLSQFNADCSIAVVRRPQNFYHRALTVDLLTVIGKRNCLLCCSNAHIFLQRKVVQTTRPVSLKATQLYFIVTSVLQQTGATFLAINCPPLLVVCGCTCALTGFITPEINIPRLPVGSNHVQCALFLVHLPIHSVSKLRFICIYFSVRNV